MKEWFQSLLDGIWGFFEFFWDVLSAAIGAVAGFLWDCILFVLMLPLQAPIWIWENVYQPAVTALVDSFVNIGFNDSIAEINLNTFNVGGLLVAICDWDYVLSVWGVMGGMFVLVAIGKFTIKLIPGVG